MRDTSRQFCWEATLAEWLAGLFIAPVSAATIDSYRAGVGATFLRALGQEPGCETGARQIRLSLSGEVPAAEVARRIGIAFTYLFEGLGGPRAVPAFESVHVSPSGLLFQAQAGAMDARLRQAALVMTDGTGSPADHLSIELALLARLMRRGATRREQAALLDRHLLGWTSGFAGQVIAADDTGFYAGAASVLSGFLAARRASIAGGGDA
jgi:TorA-specific chaperone